MGLGLVCRIDLHLAPNGLRWTWEPWVVWSNVLPEALIALSYFLITLVLIYLIRKRKDVALDWRVALFGLFMLACGVIHSLEVYNTWHGAFRLAGILKIFTATVSLATALWLLTLVPKLLAAPGLDQALGIQMALHLERGERRAAELRLLESQERLSLMVDGVRDYALYMLDPKGKVVSWNPGAERIKGYTADEILGQDFRRFYLPEDLAAGKPELGLSRAEREGSFRDEGWRLRKDGSAFYADITLSALWDGRGHLKGFAKIVQDITHQKEDQARLQRFAQNMEELVQIKTRSLYESEARLQGFIRHAPAAIGFKGLDGRYELINPRMEVRLGLPEERILGKTDEELFPPEMGRILHQADQRIQDCRDAQEIEEGWVHADGVEHTYLTHKFPVRDNTGRCWGLGLISNDITERKEADRTLLQSQKLESMGILAGGIAHDFNNLLGAILGNLGLAQMEISPLAPARQRLDTIENLVVRASDLTRQMLAYSGRGKFQVKSLNLNELVKELTHLLAISISKKAAVRYDLQVDLPSIEGDPAQLQQVVMNLVINASDAIGEHSGTIFIRTGVSLLDDDNLTKVYDGQNLEPGRFVSLEVADDGAGMSPETMKRIFDPFFTTKFTGRGLGLAAIQGIVRGHKGGIRTYSELGKGTTFKLLFPVTTVPLEPVAAPESQEPYHGHGTVLVVDDEESIRAMAVSILGHLGFTTLEAGDGREALRLYEDHQPEIRLILMDLTMPNLDGEETYRALRHRGSTTPVILSSGFSETEAVNRFLGKGLAGFLQKPYRSTALVEAVREALEKGAREPFQDRAPT